MEVVKERSGDFLDVRVSGRLDNHWSEPFDEAISEMIREGTHHLRLDLTNVTYLSSAGIGVLMKAYHDTTMLQGSCIISAASDRVRTVLQLAGLDAILFGQAKAGVAGSAPAATAREIQSERAIFECHPLDLPRAECRVEGDPSKVARGTYTAADTGALAARSDVYAVGVGALGHGFDECRSLFGEFIACAGTAAYMPTDGTSTPDYMTTSGALVPEIQTLYALVFRGTPAHLLRFEASATGGSVPLSEIAGVAATLTGTPHFGMVIAGEVFGLVCASLRRSPAESDAARFDFPAVREWLSFTPEREYARSSSVVVGVASSSPPDEVRPFVRPLGNALHGHFHAAVTAFRSLPRGKVSIADVLAQSFQPRSVVSVVHLLRDDRPIEGAGESEFHRGACWLFPLTSLESGVAS